MKKTTLFLLLFVAGVFLFASCNKKNDPFSDPNHQLYQSLCASANGTLELKIGGKKWGNSCAFASGQFFGQTDSLYLTLYSYTGDGIYLNDGSFEWFYMILLINNKTGVYNLNDNNGAACYLAGIYDWTNGPGGPNVTLSDEQHFCTNSNLDDSGKFTVESINGTRIKGRFDLVGFDSLNNPLDIEGEFDVDYMQ